MKRKIFSCGGCEAGLSALTYLFVPLLPCTGRSLVCIGILNGRVT